jgi:hypothetical protein
MDGVAWDQNEWHYALDAKIAGPMTCQYIFVLDALNFCFWPIEGFEYDNLAKSLKNALIADSDAFSAENLANMTDDRLQSWFPCHKLPLLSERVQRLREVGAVLIDKYDGIAANMVVAAKNSAPELVRLIIENFPGFRDATVFDGNYIHFYKRAQILVGELLDFQNICTQLYKAPY